MSNVNGGYGAPSRQRFESAAEASHVESRLGQYLPASHPALAWAISERQRLEALEGKSARILPLDELMNY